MYDTNQGSQVWLSRWTGGTHSLVVPLPPPLADPTDILGSPLRSFASCIRGGGEGGGEKIGEEDCLIGLLNQLPISKSLTSL
jgi:hypothetical protein